MMGAIARAGLAEPVHCLRPVRRVAVVEPGEQVDAGTRRRQIGNADHDVDDRLGGQSGYGGASDVMDPAGNPRADDRGDRRGLDREPRWPPRVVRLYPDLFVLCHAPSLPPSGFPPGALGWPPRVGSALAAT